MQLMFFTTFKNIFHSQSYDNDVIIETVFVRFDFKGAGWGSRSGDSHDLGIVITVRVRTLIAISRK